MAQLTPAELTLYQAAVAAASRTWELDDELVEMRGITDANAAAQDERDGCIDALLALLQARQIRISFDQVLNAIWTEVEAARALHAEAGLDSPLDSPMPSPWQITASLKRMFRRGKRR